MKTQGKLKDLLKCIAEGERKLEKQRKVLGINPMFEPYAAFQRIDKDRDGFIYPGDMVNFLRDSGFGDKSGKECFYVIKYFDCDQDEALNYTEFMSMVLPCDSAQLRSEIVQRDNYFVGPDDFLSKKVEYELCLLICLEIALHNTSETFKKELTICRDYTPEDSYKAIDDINYNYVDFNNLKRFLKQHGFIPNKKDLAAIIRRMDTDADSKLT